MNKVVLSGNISTDIDLRQTTSGAPVAKFNLAVSRIKDGTDFIPIVVWNQQAENLKEYCEKGSKILLEGKMQVRDYEKDGQKKYVTEVVADRVEFLGAKKNPYEKLSVKTEVKDQLQIKDEDLPW